MKSTRRMKFAIFRNPLKHIAFWQGLGFLLLVLFIWAGLVWDVPRILFASRTDENPPGWVLASALSAGTLLVAFITVGHTYVQQKRALKGWLTVCSYCKKVKISEHAWKRIEEYIGDRTRLEFSHGICPECWDRVVTEMDEGREVSTVPQTKGPEGNP